MMDDAADAALRFRMVDDAVSMATPHPEAEPEP